MDKQTKLFAAFTIAAIVYHEIVLSRTVKVVNGLYEWNYKQAIDKDFESLVRRFRED